MKVVLSTLLAVTLVGCSGSKSREDSRRLPDPPEQPPDIARAEKIASWKGERVTLLPSRFPNVDFRRADSPRGEFITKTLDYQGRTGIVSASTAKGPIPPTTTASGTCSPSRRGPRSPSQPPTGAFTPFLCGSRSATSRDRRDGPTSGPTPPAWIPPRECYAIL